MSSAALRSRRQRPASSRSGASAGERRAAFGFLSPILLGLTAFTALPIVFSAVMSLFDWPVFGDRTFVGFSNYATLLESASFWAVLRNTLLFVVVYVPINIALSLGISLWISTIDRGRNLYRVLFFIPAVTPIVANAVIWQLMFQPRGLIARLWTGLTGAEAPNYLGQAGWAMAIVVMLVLWQSVGYNTLIFSAGLDALPGDVLEASRLDGAGPWHRLRHVILPLLTPSIFFAMVMTLISAFQLFAEPFVLTQGGPGNATETLVTYLFRTGFRQYDMGLASAIAWVVFGLIMLVTAAQFIGQRRWVHYDD